jgi:hypothetical protein
MGDEDKASGADEPEWPVHFPPGCPPPDADDLSGRIYRLVKSNPPTVKDSKSHLELGASPSQPACRRAGLSCARDRSHLEALRRAVPHRRKNHIAFADLEADDGKVAQTGPPGHHTMWLRARPLAKLHSLLKVE